MATHFYNHESELYHASMQANIPEYYGQSGNELYHYGRKGMKRGQHLPDVLDPTRELVGKAAASGRAYAGQARKVVNTYANRVSKYGIMARRSLNRNVINPIGRRVNKFRDELAKRKAAESDAKKREKYELDELRKYKAENEAKKKQRSNAAYQKGKAADYESNMKDLRARWAEANVSGDRKTAIALGKQIEAAKTAEKNRKDREAARVSEMSASSRSKSREESMAKLAKENKRRAAVAKGKSEQERMKDTGYAQQKANQAASKAAAENWGAYNDKKKRENDMARKRQEEYSKMMKRYADDRARQERERKVNRGRTASGHKNYIKKYDKRR